MDHFHTETVRQKSKIMHFTKEKAAIIVPVTGFDTKYVDISDVNGAIDKYDTSLGQTEVFNKLTNGGQSQGIYIQNGMLYINADYILSGTLAGKYINAKGISVKNIYNQTTLSIDDNGNVNINASTFSLSGAAVATESYVSNKTAQALSEAKIYADQKTGKPPERL